MARTRISITREFGMALAVLALWLMSLLVPLHQASGLLRELARAGYDISGAWSICVTLAQDEDSETQLPAVCPAQGIGKNDVAQPPLPNLLAEPVRIAHDARYFVDQVAPDSQQRFQPGQPRGPPAFA